MLGHSIAERLQRLAVFFKVDPESLSREFVDYYAMASTIQNGTVHLNNAKAWKAAIDRVAQSRASTRDSHTAEALLPVLQALIGWSHSTSGLEQDFAVVRALVPPQASSLEDSRLSDLLTLANLKPKFVPALIRKAQQLWALYYGFSRSVRKTSLKKFSKFNLNNQGSSEAQWLRDRRCSIDKSTATWAKQGVVKKELSQLQRRTTDFWSGKMDKEVEFQEAKRLSRLVRAERQGNILPQDLPADYIEQKTYDLKKEAVNLKRRLHLDAKVERTISESARPTFTSLRSRKVYLGRGMEAYKSQVLKAHAKRTTSTLHADVFIVNDFNLGQRLRWVAVLGGAAIMDGKYLETRGAEGHMMTFKSAIEQKRTIWASMAWAERHAILHDILDFFINKSDSWKWFAGTSAEYVRHTMRQPSTLGLVTPGDLKSTKAWNFENCLGGLRNGGCGGGTGRSPPHPTPPLLLPPTSKPPSLQGTHDPRPPQ